MNDILIDDRECKKGLRVMRTKWELSKSDHLEERPCYTVGFVDSVSLKAEWAVCTVKFTEGPQTRTYQIGIN